ncbi:MAG: S8 family serine peptidase, partial [Desulfocucumaceae bacterium]
MRVFKLRGTSLLILTFFLSLTAALAGDSYLSGHGEGRFLNDRSSEIVGADLLNAPGFITPGGLTGKGQVVAVADSGVDKGSLEDIHPDLASDPGKRPRIIMLKSWAGRLLADDPLGHGTHMVGTIAGSGKASEGKYRGLAPEVSVYFQGILDDQGRIAPPRDINELFLPAYQAGSRIHVNAWGSGTDTYSANASRTDAFVRQHPDFLVIFGAGNSGPGEKTLTSEANSKNALVVGASVSPRPALDFSPEGTLDTASFSSRGAAGDGRIKPDLTAPGTSIISARSSLIKGNLPEFPLYSRMQGSSMSSAVAAGSTALLREFLQRDMSLPDPRAATFKAALINGSRTGALGPSREGFGVLDLAGTVLALKEKTMLLEEERAGLTAGAVKTYKIKVQDQESPFKATLSWTDPAGEMNSRRALVNNLDLEIISPDGKKYLGNSFLGQAADELNNVEQVYINKPLPGEYLVQIKATAVAVNASENTTSSAQDYSLVYGQPLTTGIIKDVVADGFSLYGGGKISTAGRKIHYILNGSPSDNLKPDTGYRLYSGGNSVYMAGRQWNSESARFIELVGGRIWFELDGDSHEGGYYQSTEAGRGVTVNGSLREDIKDLPQGVVVRASLDCLTQTLWKVVTGYSTENGSVAGTVLDEKGEITSIHLFNDSREYNVSPGASYIYSDTFEGTDPLEVVFGAGNLDGLSKIMPGQQVTLVYSP